MIKRIRDVIAERPFVTGATAGALPWFIVFNLFVTHEAAAKTYVTKDEFRQGLGFIVQEVRDLRMSVEKLIYEVKKHG